MAGYVKPTGEDELRASLGTAFRARRKRVEGKKPPMASEETSPGQYRYGIPEGLPDIGERLAASRVQKRRERGPSYG